MNNDDGLEVPPNPGYISTTTEYQDAEALARRLRPTNGRIWIYMIDTCLARNIKFTSMDKVQGTSSGSKTYAENEWRVHVKIPVKTIVGHRVIKENGKLGMSLYDNFGASRRPRRTKCS
ncbi:hypothetical protein PpBr36_04096 [Pyricularia pennisetigena]|uniref:hypothetical protein n=1 Tax=Pyricularia pennisetigena TaxID=1578925 RepID=UPI0011529DBE|nr:hypothetical protein PpBr36_04096 [Pyricularia pennisetigena]TLS26257.1 hypothetical protein PpBr36_04096 [Pyricularia pennisetigena]